MTATVTAAVTARLVLKQLQLRNFLSFGNNLTEIDLSQPGSTLIQGENLDANTANGAGKTTIFNAICYAIYNKPFDNISLQRLINSTNSPKNTLMEVRLTFTKGNDEYEVYRCRGESTNVRVVRNGEDITLDSIAETDAVIEEIVGLSYDLFTKIIIFSGSSTPFLQLPVQPQRQLIEELFNITLLSEKAVRLKEIIRETEKDIVVQAAVIKEQEGAINLYNRQLKEAQGRRDRWEQERAAQLSALKEQLELLSSLDLEQERQLHEQVEELKAAKRERDLACSILSKDHRQLTKDVSTLEGEVKHLLEDKCPYCLQRYAGAAEKLHQQEELLEQKREQLRALSEQLGAAQADVTELTAALKELEAKLTLPSHRAVLEAKANRETIAHRLQELATATNPHEEALALLEQHRPAPVAYERLDELKRDLEHQEFLLKLLTDKNSFIRRKIINRMIPFLNARLEHYTRSLGVTHLIRFDDNMTCTVSEYGRELDFGNLSSGEKKRVNFSLSLAFRDVLHHLHYKVNGLFIDEIDGSLDATGVEAIFKLLKQKTRDERLSLFIISHRPEAVGRFDRQLLIRKQNGFSRVINPGEEEGAAGLAL